MVAKDDQRRLTEAGILANDPKIRIQDGQSYLSQIRHTDRNMIERLVREVSGLNGKALRRKTYLDYPIYASRSRAAKKTLTDSELEMVRSALNTDHNPCLFTLGYEGLSIDAYLNILIRNNVKLLIDVRNNPMSRKFGFSKAALAVALHNAKIRYLHLPQLGVPAAFRRTLTNADAYEELFTYYATTILPTASDEIQRLKVAATKAGRTVITCFEANPALCHRHKLVEYLVSDPAFSTPIVHLS